MNRSDARILNIDTLEPLVLMSASSAEVEIDELFSVIAVDLNGDGEISITGQTTAKNKSGVTEAGDTVAFDIKGDDKLYHVEWFSGSGDAILVDYAALQGNEIDGDALFGDGGFEKLAGFDGDGNHLLDKNEMSRLRLWVDNGNGAIDSGELQKLSDHDIYSLGLQSYQDVPEGRDHGPS